MSTATAVELRILDSADDMCRVAILFDQIWGSATPLVGVELLRAISHAGGYVAAAERDGELVGASVGFLARHDGVPALHSHITGVLPGVRGQRVGRMLKGHQRDWAAEHALDWVTWTFDPLVRANAWFNLQVLGACVHEYLVDFYGPLDDTINAGGESDRLLVAWAVHPASSSRPSDPWSTTRVPTPDDIVTLRRADPKQAAAWRRRLRDELGGPMATGARVVGFTRAGEYQLQR